MMFYIFSVDKSCVSLVGFILKHFVFLFFNAAAASIVLIYVFINLALYLILGGQVWLEEVRGQRAGISSLLPPCGSWGRNPGCRVWYSRRHLLNHLGSPCSLLLFFFYIPLLELLPFVHSCCLDSFSEHSQASGISWPHRTMGSACFLKDCFLKAMVRPTEHTHTDSHPKYARVSISFIVIPWLC